MSSLPGLARDRVDSFRGCHGHFPELHRQVSHRNRKQLRLKIENAGVQLETEMLGTMPAIAAAGLLPTPKNIEKALKRPELFKRRAPRRALEKVISVAMRPAAHAANADKPIQVDLP